MNIFDIQRGAYHDGPGIRTVIFLKGCNLRCFWCQNPESQSAKAELFFDPAKCIGCGKCVEVCEAGCHRVVDGVRRFDRSKCVRCCHCANVCNAEAIRAVGECVSEKELLEIVLKDKEIYDLSGGGVTLSGGEPLLQYRSCQMFLKMAKEAGVNTAIETAGNVPWKAFEAVIPYLDAVLYDVKTGDSTDHVAHCGAGNELVMNNLPLLDAAGIDIYIRIPVIPGVNDNCDSISNILDRLAGMEHIKTVELLPFHSLGSNKYRLLGREYNIGEITSPSRATMGELKGLVEKAGF